MVQEVPTNVAILPIDQTPAHELVVAQLKRAILLGRYLPGDKLPAERALAEHLNVSRTSVRSAIRLLSDAGLLEIKRGAAGGAFVQNVTNDNIRAKLQQQLTRRSSEFEQLIEFRLANECAAARLAAERCQKPDLHSFDQHVRKMDQLVAEAADGGSSTIATRFYAEDTAFHIAIAEVSRNDYLIEAVEQIRYELFFFVIHKLSGPNSCANHWHHALIDAIGAGDGDAAYEAMRSHILATVDRVSSPE